MGQFKTIQLEIQGAITWLTIQRESALNALNSTVLKELDQAIDQLQRSQRVLIIRGAGGKAFVAGADIREMQNFNAEEAISFSNLGQRVLRKLENLPQIVIACVNGYALGGGCELALACDLVYAS